MKLNQEIRSEFHSDRYIGFILTNKDKSGYEVQLYDKTGKQIINREITGEYSHVKIAGDEIIMFDGTKDVSSATQEYSDLRETGE